MASYSKRGTSWRAEVCIDMKRKSKTFPTKREAVAWANEQEQGGILAQHTFRQALEKYEPISMTHRGAKAEMYRLKTLAKAPFADAPLENITPAMIAKWRDKRLTEVEATSVRREMGILGAMLQVAVREWGWIRTNPLRLVKKPSSPPARRRGISKDEIEKILVTLNETGTGRPIASMFELALETGMRLSEITGLEWDRVREKSVLLDRTKNEDERQVPLSPRAREIIAAWRGHPKPFAVDPKVASKRFERARTKAGCPGVHFHGARSEAITRLSKELDVLQLAKVIGHRDPKSLLFYYSETADEIADAL